MCASSTCSFLDAGRSSTGESQDGHIQGCGSACSSSPDWMALSSLSSCRLMLPAGLSFSKLGFAGVGVGESWLAGVGVLVVPGVSFSESLVSDSGAIGPNLLPTFHELSPGSRLTPSPLSIIWLVPIKTKRGLRMSLPVC